MKFCPTCEKEYGDDVNVCPDDGAQLMGVKAEDEDPLVGSQLTDRIRVDAKIGEGGMGSVYKGEDVLLGRTVAIKVMRSELASSKDDVKRFFNEAKVLAKLRHPNTIQVFDFGQANTGDLYIAMEFMTGEPLDEFVEENPLTLARIVEVLDQVCQSLEEAHAGGIIHRDLKPENIFIDSVNNRRIVKVIDFGIAKLTRGGENLTATGMVFGTPAYMSPEQVQGKELDPRSDIYALGVILYQLLSGRLPFEGDNPMEIAIQHITQPPPPVSERCRFEGTPDELFELVMSMLAKDPDERPPSVAAVREQALQIAVYLPDVQIDSTSDTGSVVRVRTNKSRRNAVAGATGGGTSPQTTGGVTDELASAGVGSKRGLFVAALFALLALGGGAFFMLGGGETEAPEEAAPTEAQQPVAQPVEEPEPTPEEQAELVATAIGGAMNDLESAIYRARVAMTEGVVPVLINSEPSGAQVFLGDHDEPIGETPFNHSFPRIDEEVVLRFDRDGYEEAEHSFVPTGDPVSVELDRERERRTTRREPSAPTQERTGGSDRGTSGSTAAATPPPEPEPEPEPEEASEPEEPSGPRFRIREGALTIPSGGGD